MPPATFDFGGKVVLVTGVGRAGQIGNAVALAFGTAGAKIVACDVNAMGVTERVREFAAQGWTLARAPAISRTPTSRHSRSRRRSGTSADWMRW